MTFKHLNCYLLNTSFNEAPTLPKYEKQAQNSMVEIPQQSTFEKSFVLFQMINSRVTQIHSRDKNWIPDIKKSKFLFCEKYLGFEKRNHDQFITIEHSREVPKNTNNSKVIKISQPFYFKLFLHSNIFLIISKKKLILFVFTSVFEHTAV